MQPDFIDDGMSGQGYGGYGGYANGIGFGDTTPGFNEIYQ